MSYYTKYDECESTNHSKTMTYEIKARAKATQIWDVDKNGNLRWLENEMDTTTSDIEGYIIEASGSDIKGVMEAPDKLFETYEQAQKRLKELQNDNS